jgi:hypothetical protein
MHGPCRGARARSGPGACRRSDGYAASRDHDLLSVGDERSAVHELELGFRSGAPGTREGIGHPRPIAEPIQAWSPNRADHVDVDVPRPRLRRGRRRRADGRRHGDAIVPEEHASGQHEHHDEGDGPEQEASAIDCEIRHVVNIDNTTVTRM